MDKTIEEKLLEVAENVPKVYEAGYNKCLEENPPGATEEELQEKYEEGFVKGKTEGIKEGYDVFWDAYQQNGTRGNYSYAFCERGWNTETLNPKYKIVTSTGERMFYRCNSAGKTRLDMTEVCEKLDTSQATSATYMFMDAFLENVTVDLGNVTTLNNCFNSGNIGGNKSIRNVILKVTDKCTTFTNAFAYCTATEEIIFTDDSVIANNGLNVRWSTKLNKASIKSIINALSTEKEGLTVTLSQIAVDNAFETVKGAADGSTSAEWSALEATKTNWHISLFKE